jgi:hypothetical protein
MLEQSARLPVRAPAGARAVRRPIPIDHASIASCAVSRAHIG